MEKIWKPVEEFQAVLGAWGGFIENTPKGIAITDALGVKMALLLPPDKFRLCVLIEMPDRIQPEEPSLPHDLIEEVRSLAEAASMTGQGTSVELDAWLKGLELEEEPEFLDGYTKEEVLQTIKDLVSEVGELTTTLEKWKPVPESLEYDILTAAIREGKLPEGYTIYRREVET